MSEMFFRKTVLVLPPLCKERAAIVHYETFGNSATFYIKKYEIKNKTDKDIHLLGSLLLNNTLDTIHMSL